MSFIKTPMKGMRDFLPQEMEVREYVLDTIKQTYSKFGFSQIETPFVEHISNLTSNQGGDNEKLIFKILKRGEKLENSKTEMVDINDLSDSGLRYDLTVPLSRYYANNASTLSSPFRAMQLGYVWRADRPQRGRFRQFMQCDVDILGEDTNLAEVDLLMAFSELFERLDINEYTIKINDRKILKMLANYAGFSESDYDKIFVSLDKLDKIGSQGVRQELLSLGFDSKIVDKYLEIYAKDINLSTNDKNGFWQNLLKSEKYKNFVDESIVDNVFEIINTVKKVKFRQNISFETEKNINIIFDPTLVRGMGYYTGTIFEVEMPGLSGSVAGGGRYDDMIGKFIGKNVSACGLSVGFERIVLLLTEQGFKVPGTSTKSIALIISDKNNKDLVLLAQTKAYELRRGGTKAIIAYKNKNFVYQKQQLESLGYKIVVV